MENNPQVVFEKLFGDGGNNADRRRGGGRAAACSIRCWTRWRRCETSCRQQIASLAEYLDNVREIERRIQKADTQFPGDLELPDAPVGVPESFDEHFKIMYDLEVLAFRAEITRVATMMYARDTSLAVYPQSGVRESFHVASHHSNSRAQMDGSRIINRYHV